MQLGHLLQRGCLPTLMVIFLLLLLGWVGFFFFLSLLTSQEQFPKAQKPAPPGLGPAHASSCLHPPRLPDLRRPRQELRAVALILMLEGSLPLHEATGNLIWEICAAWPPWLPLRTPPGQGSPWLSC